MNGTARLSLGLTLALSLASAVQAQSYDGFDSASAATPAERLVLCDTTAFLATRPNLSALRIVPPRQDGMSPLLLPPNFLSGGQIYGDRYERLMRKLIAQHQATFREIVEVQATKGKAMVDIYRTSHHVDHPFAVRQERSCRAFAKTYGVRGNF